MDAELITQLARFGPWGIAFGIVFLLRKEVATIFNAPKDDRAVEGLLKGMQEQFVANMVLFRETNHRLQNIEALLTGLTTVQREILTETARGRR